MTEAAPVTEPIPPERLVVPVPPRARLDAAVAAARDWLVARQTPEGFWQGEL